ncbi:collagen alpha-1(I) chain-like [Crotalus tigris]|uniref:collagen alpha-1(I) chain-like n=1 Tax=Crotalus tigris TaxID=88082 RepID=UPI00192F6E28|nr:collagen alpha-1(I) chain-like [Crotalus tigris]
MPPPNGPREPRGRVGRPRRGQPRLSPNPSRRRASRGARPQAALRVSALGSASPPRRRHASPGAPLLRRRKKPPPPAPGWGPRGRRRQKGASASAPQRQTGPTAGGAPTPARPPPGAPAAARGGPSDARCPGAPRAAGPEGRFGPALTAERLPRNRSAAQAAERPVLPGCGSAKASLLGPRLQAAHPEPEPPRGFAGRERPLLRPARHGPVLRSPRSAVRWASTAGDAVLGSRGGGSRAAGRVGPAGARRDLAREPRRAGREEKFPEAVRPRAAASRHGQRWPPAGSAAAVAAALPDRVRGSCGPGGGDGPPPPPPPPLRSAVKASPASWLFPPAAAAASLQGSVRRITTELEEMVEVFSSKIFLEPRVCLLGCWLFLPV